MLPERGAFSVKLYRVGEREGKGREMGVWWGPFLLNQSHIFPFFNSLPKPH
ncbi:hypothetical protein Hdeb2414_s0006g00201501 [Helianthus debilis subsp. tardiflorus]